MSQDEINNDKPKCDKCWDSFFKCEACRGLKPDAPREWKLLIGDMDLTVYDESEFDSCPEPNGDDPECDSSAEELVHVIEKSAYEALAKRVEELEAMVDQTADDLSAVADLLRIKAPHQYKVVQELAAAKAEIEYLNRQLADERSGDCDKDKTIRRLESNLTQANAEIERLKTNNTIAGDTVLYNYNQWQAANARIAELEKMLQPSANKYYFDQMHKYWDENTVLKEREQKLVAVIKKFLNEKQLPNSENNEVWSLIDFINWHKKAMREVLKAHKEN